MILFFKTMIETFQIIWHVEGGGLIEDALFATNILNELKGIGES